MENEKKNPSQTGNKKQNPIGQRGQYDKDEYLKNLEKAMENEEKNSGYKPSNKKYEDHKNDFYEKFK